MKLPALPLYAAAHFWVDFACALLLLPMSLTMIASSLLNSIGCEKHTLAVFLAGSAAMLACTFLLPCFLGGGALLAGMACDNLITALLSLLLLKKKTGRLPLGGHLAKLFCALAPVTVAAYFLHRLLALYLSYLPALALTMLFLAAGEAAMLALLRLVDLKGLLGRFFAKKRKKIVQQS